MRQHRKGLFDGKPELLYGRFPNNLTNEVSYTSMRKTNSPTELYGETVHKGELHLSTFDGGEGVGLCLQIVTVCEEGAEYACGTMAHACITEGEVHRLITVLEDFRDKAVLEWLICHD